jgi:hypothetical protein
MTATPEHHDDQAQPDTDPRPAARRVLLDAVRIHRAVHTVREDYPPGSDGWCTATPLVRALDGAVRRQIETARTAGIGPVELARIVGVSRYHIGRIVQEERALLAAANSDGAARSARDAAVAEVRAAEAECVAVRETPPSVKRADTVGYNIRRCAARRRLHRALHAAQQDGGLTIRELAAEVELGTAVIRRILASAYRPRACLTSSGR